MKYIKSLLHIIAYLVIFILLLLILRLIAPLAMIVLHFIFGSDMGWEATVSAIESPGESFRIDLMLQVVPVMIASYMGVLVLDFFNTKYNARVILYGFTTLMYGFFTYILVMTYPTPVVDVSFSSYSIQVIIPLAAVAALYFTIEDGLGSSFKKQAEKILIVASIIFLVVVISVGVFSYLKQDYFVFCNEIQDKNQRDECYFDVAITYNQDGSICNKIQEQELRDHCYRGVAIRLKDNPYICEKIEEQRWKDSCYQSVSKSKQDLAICEEIKNKISKDSCYRGVAKSKQDSAICEKIEDKISKDSCYQSVAKSKQDLSVCEEIKEQRLRGSCHSSVAKIKQAISNCEKFKNLHDKDACYKEEAVSQKESFLCQKIQDQQILVDCTIRAISEY